MSTKALKDNCKHFYIPYQKTQSKSDLLRSFGQKLCEEKKGQRKNDNEVICHDNLVTVPKESSAADGEN